VQNGNVKETELATITLTPKAEERLGIRTVQVEFGPAPRSETLAGEVVVPPGQALVLSAPVAGTLQPADNRALQAGARVERGRALFRLMPLLPVQRDLTVTAEAELASARTSLEAARQRRERAERMLRDGTGSARALEDARQEFELAETASKTAEAKLEQLKRAPLDSDVLMTIPAPLSGIVRQIFAAPGQQVASGAALAEVVQIDPVWIRVPVYSGRLPDFVPGAAARVRRLGAKDDGARAAKPVPAPPKADPLAVTADLYFELSNSGAGLRPGEKVEATLPLRGREASLKVPAASILYDMHGGAWLYESTAPQVFVRRRVEIAQMQGDVALLRAGPAEGARVVTLGAAELFGTEFGPGK
jgi:RND family efflux transporter MFP subunit